MRAPQPWTHRWVLLGAAMTVGVPVAAAADELPVPRGVKLSAAHDMRLGAQSVTMQGFSAAQPMDALRDFYARELPKRGWKIGPIPWMAEELKHEETFKQTTQEHAAEIEADPEVKRRVAQVDFGRLQTQMKRSLHAQRGEDRLIVAFMPDPDGGAATSVFAYRWKEPASSPRPGPFSQSGADAFLAQQGWGLKNPCCQGDALPVATSSQLPGSVPVYPNAKAFGGMAPQGLGARGLSTELYLSADGPEQVAGYYRQEMERQGWAYAPTSGGPDLAPYLGDKAQSVKMQTLNFRRGEAACLVTIGESLAPLPEGTPPNERTMIAVTHLTLPSAASRTYRPPTAVPHSRRSP